MQTANGLTQTVKVLARRLGAVGVGIASRENLAGPPEADTDYVLPGARTAVMYYVVLDDRLIRRYLTKEDVWQYRNHFFENLQRLGDIGRRVAEALRAAGFGAAPQSPNGVYRPGSTPLRMIPPFSLRYGAFAAGLGHFGRSGLIITPEYGARVQLGGVVTDAPLRPDEPLEESACEDCKICIKACPTGFMSPTEKVTFTIGGREVTYAKKAVHLRCAVSCGGMTGLSAGGKWSTWSTGRWQVPKDDKTLVEQVQKPEVQAMLAEAGRGFIRFSRVLNIDGYEQPGVLARAREDTLTTCGNCSIICVGSAEKRKELWRLLTQSGVVIEGQDGEPVAVPPARAREILAEREQRKPANQTPALSEAVAQSQSAISAGPEQ